MRFEELDPATRRAIRRSWTTSERAPVRSRPSRAEADDDAGSFRCKACGETFDAFRTAERHVNDEHQGGVIELTLGVERPQGG